LAPGSMLIVLGEEKEGYLVEIWVKIWRSEEEPLSSQDESAQQSKKFEVERL
jgi:hypothetical protein